VLTFRLSDKQSIFDKNLKIKNMRKILLIFITLITLFLTQKANAQEYIFDDFIGTWNGYYSSENWGGTYTDLTMVIYEDGFYTDSSGEFMPSIYPNTQQCEYEASTNRMHWWYLQTVYAGQYFYQHFYYDIVYFENDTLEMHYNFWDDEVPYPTVGTLFLVKENQTPPPIDLMAEIYGDDVVLSWDAPNNIPEDVMHEAYRIYYAYNDESFEMLDELSSAAYVDTRNLMEGDHYYYVTAVYDIGESDPSETLHINNSTTGINQIGNSSLSVFPNPASNFIQIQSEEDIQTIDLLNVSGQIVKQYQPKTNNFTIDLDQIQKGIYFIKIYTEKGIEINEILVQ